MNEEIIARWQHSHVFGQDQMRQGEKRTLIVVAITAVMMVVELVTGVLFGSMALLADGLHMASHAAALGINVIAYSYARRHARDDRFSFGTGKVNALGGFTGAVLLGLFALMMVWESAERFVNPVDIAFNEAIAVAIAGLMVNGASVFILGFRAHRHDHGHDHPHGLDHHHHYADQAGQEADHNLKSAYLHVLADALTSVLAIFALVSAKSFGLIWMDPLMGIVGAALVARWSLGLLRSSSDVLLDRQGPKYLEQEIRGRIECDGDSRVAEIHLWSLGPGLHGAIISIVAEVCKTPEQYKQQLPPEFGLVHVTVEVNESGGGPRPRLP